MVKWVVEMKRGKLWKPYTTIIYPSIRFALTELSIIYGRKKIDPADWRVKPATKEHADV